MCMHFMLAPVVLKLKCGNCREVQDKWQYVNLMVNKISFHTSKNFCTLCSGIMMMLNESCCK